MGWAFRRRKSSDAAGRRRTDYRKTRIGLEAFLDGFTGAGLFGRLRQPGAPTEIFDSRSVEEYLASGEFEETLRKFGHEGPERLKRPAHNESPQSTLLHRLAISPL